MNGYTHCAGQGSFDLAVFPAVSAWLERVRDELGLEPMAAWAEPGKYF